MGHNIDVSSESVSFELGFSDCFLLRIEIPFLGQKKNRFPLSVLRRLNCDCEFASIFVSIYSAPEFRISSNDLVSENRIYESPLGCIQLTKN